MTSFNVMKMTLNNVNNAAMPLIQVRLFFSTLNYSLVVKNHMLRVY